MELFVEGMHLASCMARGNLVELVLSDSTMSDGLSFAQQIEGKDVEVVDDHGSLYRVFSGYAVTEVAVEGKNARIHLSRRLDEATEKSIRALEANFGNLNGKYDGIAAQMAALSGTN